MVSLLQINRIFSKQELFFLLANFLLETLVSQKEKAMCVPESHLAVASNFHSIFQKLLAAYMQK